MADDPNQKKLNLITNDDMLIFLPIITAGMYLSIFFYFGFYFRTIGIEQSLLNLSLDYYIVNGSIPIFIVIMTFSLVMIGVIPNDKYPKSIQRLIAFISNFPFLLVGILIAYWAVTSDKTGIFSFVVKAFFLILAFGFVIFYLIFSLVGVSLSHSLSGEQPTYKLGIIIAFLLFCGIFSIAAGEYAGNEFIKGTIPNAIQIQFNFANESSDYFSNDLSNETLLLILHRDGNYYVTSLNKSKTKFNPIYIIPDGQVTSAKLNQIY